MAVGLEHLLQQCQVGPCVLVEGQNIIQAGLQPSGFQ